VVEQPILVTGATGFIGRRLVARLVAEGRAVRALVLPSETVDPAWGAVEVRRGDVTDRAAVAAALDGARTLLHLAAVVGDWGDEALFQRVTVGGTRHLLEAAARGTRVVLASSVVVYGDAVARDTCDEEHAFGRALGAYSRSKQAQERLAWELARARDLALTVVRPTNVYGPGSRPWVHDVVAQLRRGLPALIGGGGGNAGLCHVDNVVEAFVLAAKTERAAGRAYNASDGSDVTWARYFDDLARIAGAPPPRSLPRAVAAVGARACETAWTIGRLKGRPPLTREALNLIGSNHRVPIDRARAELGYAPRVDYAHGIASVADYVRDARL
jgi:nucleoside-diphosphate-sugar epimerase